MCSVISKMTVKYKLKLLILSCFILNSTAQKNVGERCSMKNTNAQGVCRKISDCPEAEAAVSQGLTQTICGFVDNRTPIVCCTEDRPKPNDNTFLNFGKPVDYRPIVFGIDETEPSFNDRFSSKSQQKCTEYSKLVTDVVNAVPLVTNPDRVSVDVVKCNHNGVALIVGGEPASPGEFPFMAAIGYNTDDGTGWLCGGTLISEYFVVTAAHCAITRFYGPPVKIRLGEIDLKRTDDGTNHMDYDIQDIKIHEQYQPPAHYNDIALLKTSREVTFNEFVRPACLWNKINIDYDVTIATGWGNTGFMESQSDKLLKVALNVYDNSICNKTYNTDRLKLPNGIVSSMLCVGNLQGGKDTCQGDSGGPLIVSNPKNRCISFVVGVTSFGRGCGGPKVPGVYTRISHYLPWIEKYIW